MSVWDPVKKRGKPSASPLTKGGVDGGVGVVAREVSAEAVGVGGAGQGVSGLAGVRRGRVVRGGTNSLAQL